MAEPFINVRFHSNDRRDEVAAKILEPRPLGTQGELAPGADFTSDEAAARYYLGQVLGQDGRDLPQTLNAPVKPNRVPDFKLLGIRDQRGMGTRVVRFVQTWRSIPIFGSLAVIELDDIRGLVSADAELASVSEVSPVASISPSEALRAIGQEVGTDPDVLLKSPPKIELQYYFDKTEGAWHLVFHATDVPTRPPADRDRSSQEGLPPLHSVQAPPSRNFLVDAHDGHIVDSFSSFQTIAVRLEGTDEWGKHRVFHGSQRGETFELADPIRGVKTYDLDGADIRDRFPDRPVQQRSGTFSNAAAVSAHDNICRVHEFFWSVLKRDSIDDLGMDIFSAVNCTYSPDGMGGEWRNAAWWRDRIWFGRARDAGGPSYAGYARHLDIVAHEYTHGVTQYAAGLVYKGLPGALNESISDIFAILIKNWNVHRFEKKTDEWDWQVGPGLGENGGPLRDLRRPGPCVNMKFYKPIGEDNGGVHLYSGLHNRAAYNVLVAKCGSDYVFDPIEVALLYYCALTKLSPEADFSKMLSVLIGETKTYYAASPRGPDPKIDCLRKCYGELGITEAV